MKAISKKTGRTIVVKEIFENIFYDVDGNSYLIEDFDFIDNNHWQEVRERAAIAALTGILADTNTAGSIDDFAETAVAYADALIEQLKKKLKG